MGRHRVAGRLATGLGGSLLLPFLVELSMASMLDQNFSFRRSAIFVSVLAGGSGLLLAVDRLAEYRKQRAEQRARPEVTQVPAEHVTHHALTPYGPETDGVVALCASRLDVSSLHYVAYHARGKGLFRVDVLDHPDLAPLVGLATPDRHRRIYENYGTRLKALMAHLDDDFDELDSGRLVRLVLDVEKGAVFIIEVHEHSGRYLLGVTLDQSHVDTADEEMRGLTAEIRQYLGHPAAPTTGGRNRP